MSLNLNELRELLTAINQMDIAELTLKSDDFELTVRRGLRADEQLLTSGLHRIAGAEAGLPGTLPATVPVAPPTSVEAKPPEGGSPSVPAAFPPTNDRRWTEILSPMVGTFYRAPAPDEPPFVDVGDRIRVGQTVCIIEAMKLMNEIESEVAGEVIEILVQNGEPVEYNQPLMRIAPA
ncbi:MAG: acetyl-CoA carboxylase biotin carboxyl carrier protein [Leptolyngbyaceae cyanobacterium]|uniref:acetyl-CoA carboxylase biotin carboxyl carrier protein n=1 Tax=Leptodesmis TaxID=2664261 RepID=UPI001F170B0C|nr:acetyl-CoA carboxylase biotin carboxyl carrier protein [Leptodesmis sichuanensis]UIE38810.1 acetyl-CoA carboxylase biotin carboxyl carrier protein [Leptodesmis sichuanensis A121]